MTENFELDITDILIVAEKNEEANFHFFNKKRSWDGFIMLTEGSGYAVDKNGVRHDFTKGDVIIACKGDSYEVGFDEPCSYITTAFTLHTDKCDLPFITKCSDRQYGELLKICKIWQSRSWDSYVRCRVGLILFYLELIKSSANTGNYDKDIENAVKFIHEHFKTNFSGQELADYCCVSLSYLRAKFLKQTGMTVGKYRESLRIASAKEMLESGYFTVTEIATQLGFCDVYHFSKVFSACVGCSPTSWIKFSDKT